MKSLLLSITLLLAACTTVPPTNVHQPMTARPQYRPENAVPNGSIYQAGNSRTLFEDRRARYVGDTMTINITETTSAATKSNTVVNKRLNDVKLYRDLSRIRCDMLNIGNKVIPVARLVVPGHRLGRVEDSHVVVPHHPRQGNVNPNRVPRACVRHSVNRHIAVLLIVDVRIQTILPVGKNWKVPIVIIPSDVGERRNCTRRPYGVVKP